MDLETKAREVRRSERQNTSIGTKHVARANTGYMLGGFDISSSSMVMLSDVGKDVGDLWWKPDAPLKSPDFQPNNTVIPKLSFLLHKATNMFADMNHTIFNSTDNIYRTIHRSISFLEKWNHFLYYLYRRVQIKRNMFQEKVIKREYYTRQKNFNHVVWSKAFYLNYMDICQDWESGKSGCEKSIHYCRAAFV